MRIVEGLTSAAFSPVLYKVSMVSRSACLPSFIPSLGLVSTLSPSACSDLCKSCSLRSSRFQDAPPQSLLGVQRQATVSTLFEAQSLFLLAFPK